MAFFLALPRAVGLRLHSSTGSVILAAMFIAAARAVKAADPTD